MGLMSCGSSTYVTGSWKNPEVTQDPYESVMVTVLTPNMEAKRAIENHVVAELRDDGVNATSSLEKFPPNFLNDNPDKDAILNKVKEENYSTILTINLLDSETETRYVEGTYAPYTTYGYYGTFGTYYNNYYPTVYDPGYYTTTRTYFIESNLYDINTEKLIWSAQSETYEPATLESAAEGLADAIVDEMEDDNIIRG
jgi:hypothetical protein